MQVFKYFLIIFVCLILLLVLIQALLYIPIISFIPSDIVTMVTDNIAGKIYILLGIIIIVSFLAALLLNKTFNNHNKLVNRVALEEQLTDISNDLIYAYSIDGECIYINRKAYESHGYNRKMLKKVDIKKLDFADFANVIKPRLKDIEEKGEIVFESTHKIYDNYVPAEVHSSLVNINIGGKKIIICAVHDVSHTRKTEEELKRSSEKLQRALDGTINTMAYTAEIRDPYTAGHQQRVARLAVAIAREMNLNEGQIESIRVAGMLHDIGKIYVPAEILSRPGKLRQNEFNLVKDHSEIGYDLLKGIEFPWPVAKIVLQHHERLNGSGYPKGLISEKILTEAQIIGVADVVESMASHRPYRPAYSVEKALLEMIQNKGVLYNVEAVEACIRLFTENRFQFETKN